MKKDWKPAVFGGALIVLLTVAAYAPALRAGFVWDDDDYVTENKTLHDLHGLWRIWFEPGATPQYYPLVHTTFWIEQHLWGLNPLGYHLVNVLLHALASVLLWRLLVRLQVPGAWIASAIFALHPVQVESVAWITERKNVLAAVFYFAAALVYLRGPEIQDSKFKPQKYFFALLLFIAALLSKTVTCSLPAALLLVLWWKKGRLQSKDILPLVPFFVAGIAFGLLTAWVEKHHVGAVGADWALTPLQRCLIAGRALWFYAGKLLWPANLTFIYPRWEADSRLWWQWLFPLAALGVVVVLWLARRRIGRGPLVAVLFFAGTLFPALGFVNTYPMRYSFVADHFQYLAGLGLIVLVADGIARIKSRVPISIVLFLALGVCGVLTAQRVEVYESLETLWRDTLRKNPACWMAHNNLGMLLSERGSFDEAKIHYYEALKLKPDYAEALSNLSSVLLQEGRVEEAMTNIKRALQSEPKMVAAMNNFGAVLLAQDRYDDAIWQFKTVLSINPNDARALNNLGAAFSARQQWAEALSCYEKSTRVDPQNATARYNLGNVLIQLGKTNEAAAQFERAIQSSSSDSKVHRELARMLASQGRVQEAVAQYRETLRLAPEDAQAHYNLGVLLAGSGQTSEAMEQFRTAIKLNPANAEAQNNLAVALASSGKLDEAMVYFAEALKLNTNYAEAHNNMAFVLAQLNRRDEAVAHLREALRLKPDYAQARQQLRGLGVNVPE